MVKPWGLGVVTLSMLLCMTAAKSSCAAQQKVKNSGNFYVGLGYGPVISEVNNFSMGVDRETKWIFQHNATNPHYLRHSENFYWDAEYAPDFKFQKYYYGFKGSAGYSISDLRIEMEVGHTESEILESGVQKKIKGGELPFVLGKEVTTNAAKKGADLYRVTEKYGLKELRDIRDYMATLPRTGTTNAADLDAVYDLVRSRINYIVNGRGYKSLLLPLRTRIAIEKMSLMVGLSRMSPERKMIFIRAIAVGTEGAEMIEIASIKSTSVTANLCYDLPQISFVPRVSPYACGGLGGSVVGITDGAADIQFAYKLKLGLNYSFRENCIIYLGASYQKVVGEDYNNVPLSRLVDDIRPTNEPIGKASVKFGLRHVDFEIGSRIIF